jgi:hypothetical protein
VYQRQSSCRIRDRGRVPQPHAGKDGKDIRVTVREIVEGGDED